MEFHEDPSSLLSSIGFIYSGPVRTGEALPYFTNENSWASFYSTGLHNMSTLFSLKGQYSHIPKDYSQQVNRWDVHTKFAGSPPASYRQLQQQCRSNSLRTNLNQFPSLGNPHLLSNFLISCCSPIAVRGNRARSDTAFCSVFVLSWISNYHVTCGN